MEEELLEHCIREQQLNSHSPVDMPFLSKEQKSLKGRGTARKVERKYPSHVSNIGQSNAGALEPLYKDSKLGPFRSSKPLLESSAQIVYTLRVVLHRPILYQPVYRTRTSISSPRITQGITAVYIFGNRSRCLRLGLIALGLPFASAPLSACQLSDSLALHRWPQS